MGVAPSRMAASSRAFGTPMKKFITMITLKMGTAPGSTRDHSVLISPSRFTTR